MGFLAGRCVYVFVSLCFSGHCSAGVYPRRKWGMSKWKLKWTCFEGFFNSVWICFGLEPHFQKPSPRELGLHSRHLARCYSCDRPLHRTFASSGGDFLFLEVASSIRSPKPVWLLASSSESEMNLSTEAAQELFRVGHVLFTAVETL